MTKSVLVNFGAWVMCACILGTNVQANEDLLDDSLFSEDFGEVDFLDEDINTSSSDELDISIEHILAWAPDQNYQRQFHSSDLRLATQLPLGLLVYGDIELKATQYWQGDSRKPSQGELSELQIEQLELQYSLAATSVKLGRYVLSWGEVEGASVLDVINPAPSPTSVDTSFTPQWLLSTQYYKPGAQISWFIGIDPSVTEIPGIPLNHSVNKEWGARIGRTGAGSDWALYAASLVPNNPILNLATSTVSAKSYQLLGYSWNKAMGDDLLKFDIAYKQGLEHNLGETGLVLDDRIDAAMGLELNDSLRQYNASLTVRHWLNYQTDYITPALEPVPSNQTDISYSLGVSGDFANDELSWSLTHLGTPNGSLMALNTQLSWAPRDALSASVSFGTIKAKADSAFAALDGNKLLTFRIKVSY